MARLGDVNRRMQGTVGSSERQAVTRDCIAPRLRDRNAITAMIDRSDPTVAAPTSNRGRCQRPVATGLAISRRIVSDVVGQLRLFQFL